MPSGKIKAKIKVTVKPQKKGPIKPKMGKGTGGVLTGHIIADVKARKSNNNNG